MILAASFEFDKKHNSEVIERSSDNEEVPQVCYLIGLHINNSVLWSITKFLLLSALNNLDVVFTAY